MQILINGLKTNRAFAVSSFFVLLLIAVALAAPLIAPYDPLEAVMQNAYLPPSAEHLFGTDKLGRDNFAIISAAFCTAQAIRFRACCCL